MHNRGVLKEFIMKNKSTLLITVIAVSFLLPAMSQETSLPSTLPQPQIVENDAQIEIETGALILTVDDAVKYAVTNSKTLKSAAIDLEIKKRQKETAWNVFIPSVSVTGTMSRSNEVTDSSKAMSSMLNPIFSSLSGMSKTLNGLTHGMYPAIDYPQITSPEVEESDHWKAVGGISAQLNLNAALLNGIKATKANYEAGLISWEQSVKQTERDVKKMFYALLLQQENLSLQQAMLTNAKERWDQADINYHNGLVPELSVLQAQVAYENRKPSILEMEQSVKQQLDTFAFLLGLPYGTKIVLSGEINPEFHTFDAADLTAKYASSRLDIQSLAKSIDMLKISLSASKVQTYTPSLSLAYSFQPLVLDVTENWFDDDNNMDNGSFSVTIAFNLSNLLPFSSASQNIKNTQDNIAKAEVGLGTLMQSAEMEIHTLVDKLNKSQVAISANNMNIDLAQKAYDMTYTAYLNGAKELLDVKDAESQLNQAQLGMVSEKFTYVTALLDLEYAINKPLDAIK